MNQAILRIGILSDSRLLHRASHSSQQGKTIMSISFGKSAYVTGTSRELINKIETSPISISATENEIIIITKESIDDYLKKYEKMTDYDKLQNRIVADFLLSLIHISEPTRPY